ncbi:MAG TPA: hypothetical protein VEM96_07560 [Pyrinomonadaceae bacterium]|nr:hypothetical protein [Pyrinomonadaceae bacterium]
MSTSPGPATKWKWCVLPSLAMVLLSLIPQIHLWIVRGRDWNGAYVSPQGDEPFYSGYLNALIDGRARKNDPFGAKDSSAKAPLPESTFSIQFVPPYVISLVARTFGASASTAFIALSSVAALLASLSVFWLLNCVAGDNRLAAAGTFFVLCLGGFAGSYGVFGTFIDIAVPALPFLRRYQPTAVFPLIFIFQVLVWRAFTTQGKRDSQVCAIIAGLTLAVLVFSYLYLWTAAAAWLVCIGALWFYARPFDRRKILAALATIGVITAIALVPYVYLLSHRAATLDEQQTLISTHRPDPFRVHEILGAVILVALITGVLRHRFERTEPRVIYTASLALLPFVVFNQQVLTGRTMQVFHFEIFAINYSTTLGLLIMATLFWKPVPRRLLIWMAGLSFLWGVIVVGLPSRVAFVPLAIANDKSIPVLLRLKELSRQDGTIADLRSKGQASALVFSSRVALIRLLPTWTSQGTLLDVGGVDFGSATREERKKFLYLHLYYSKAEGETLRKVLNGMPDDPGMGLYARSVIFGHERVTPALSLDFKPIQHNEIDQEVLAYQTYANSFTREEALRRPIAYAVIPGEGNFDFTNLDRWYERDAGERVGDYTLYRLKLRN